ncbi:long chain acyl-CoA ligase [Bacillus subtilis]|nr:long chain acyl-CoA ligase [Bacillus subtilis]
MQSQKPWLAEYPNDIPHELPLPNKTLQSILTDSAARFPDKTAISFYGKKLTFHDILTDALKLAAFLQCNGLQKGDRVAVMLPNCPQTVISYYGVLFAGGIVVQTNPLYTEHELEYQLRDAQVSVIIHLRFAFPEGNKNENVINSRPDFDNQCKRLFAFSEKYSLPADAKTKSAYRL